MHFFDLKGFLHNTNHKNGKKTTQSVLIQNRFPVFAFCEQSY